MHGAGYVQHRGVSEEAALPFKNLPLRKGNKAFIPSLNKCLWGAHHVPSPI